MVVDVNKALKDASKAVKENDFIRAAQYAKLALKVDKQNYHALVLLGRACLELGKLDDSKKALLLATKTDPNTLTAWQGLSTLMDRQTDIFTVDEKIQVLEKLKENPRDDERKVEMNYRKLALLYLEMQKPLLAAECYDQLIGRLSNDKHIAEARQNFMDTMGAIKNLSKPDVEKLLTAVERSLTDSVFGKNEANYQLYLRLLYRTGQKGRVLEAGRAMAALFPTSYPLEWVCRVVAESRFQIKNWITEGEFVSVSNAELTTMTDRLLSLCANSPWGNVCKGILMHDEGQTEMAKILVRKGMDQLESNVLIGLLLLDMQENSCDWSGVDASCQRLLPLVGEEHRNRLRSARARALYRFGHENHLREALVLLQGEENLTSDLQHMKMRIHLRLGEMHEVVELLSRLRNKTGETLEVGIIEAMLQRENGNYCDAQQKFNELTISYPESAEVLLELGRLQFHLRQLAECHLSCMKAAKLDPKCVGAFLYLGHYYCTQKDFEKARKCLEKALSLDASDEEAGIALSDVYRQLGEHEANLRLLHRASTAHGHSGWAWQRLGLHFLELGDPAEAVRALQMAVQINPGDSTILECLGDAYLSRGAHAAALKAFTKVTELNPSSLYAMFRVANIEQILGEHLISITKYEQVLASDLSATIRVVSQVGLASALLAIAHEYIQKFFFANVKDACEKIIKVLASAASKHPHSVTIWKLLGDACTLTYCLPSSLGLVEVVEWLVDRSVVELDRTVQAEKKVVLELGASCYGLSIHMNEDYPSLWHDLGLNLWRQSQVCEEGLSETARKEFLRRAILAVKKGLALCRSANAAHLWSTLGVLAASQEDWALSQHSFIKSLAVQETAETWTNLASLYLCRGDAMLAHEAYSQAQAVDPSYIACWVGQALVAENVGHSETFDLFRHTTQLGIHSESCRGYAHHVTRFFCDPVLVADPRKLHTLMQWLPKAVDCLSFVTRQNETDVVTLNMAGVALEAIGWRRSAVVVLEKAVELGMKITEQKESNMKQLNDVKRNLARVLTNLGRGGEAVPLYEESGGSLDFQGCCGLALAHTKGGGGLEMANKCYLMALELAPNEVKKSEVFVALAALAYKTCDYEKSKQLLFRSCQIGVGCVRGSYALTTLGLLSGDPTLTAAALAELKVVTHDRNCIHHVAYLNAVSTGDVKEACHILSRAVHLHPDNVHLWRGLAKQLVEIRPMGAVAASKAAANLSASSVDYASKADLYTANDAVVAALASLVGCSISSAAAQRAVLFNPDSAQAWAILIAIQQMNQHWTITQRQSVVTSARFWADRASLPLCDWLKSIAIRLQ